MSNLTFEVGFEGSPDSGDSEAALFGVERANQSRETPLPTTPASALKTSILTVYKELVEAEHANNQRAAAEKKLRSQNAIARWNLATDAERSAALNQLPSLPE